MFVINRFLGRASFLETIPNNGENKINDPENSILLKIAACIPVIGLVINQIESKSLSKKLKALPLPKHLRPYPIKGNILNENASPEEIKTVCKRAMQLDSIERDYTKAALVNDLLTIALVVSALAMNLIPFFLGAIVIGVFCLTAATFALSLYHDPINYYKERGCP